MGTHNLTNCVCEERERKTKIKVNLPRILKNAPNYFALSSGKFFSSLVLLFALVYLLGEFRCGAAV